MGQKGGKGEKGGRSGRGREINGDEGGRQIKE